ncbi:hypothetical protein CF319_g8133 [Tilletia indica]|uniref:Uncharacterized protein n=1 Tax=Tilletia indica TaxID=43049 RepID=A0A177TCK7_9BASI|nr:hypothetical protein CF319_g8133 [Tilletia indica]KAE8239578.1 hypothetical protein A4X13_0g8136 [Tilletia indica]
MFTESIFVLVASLFSFAIVKLTTKAPVWYPERPSISYTRTRQGRRRVTARAPAQRAEARAVAVRGAASVENANINNLKSSQSTFKASKSTSKPSTSKPNTSKPNVLARKNRAAARARPTGVVVMHPSTWSVSKTFLARYEKPKAPPTAPPYLVVKDSLIVGTATGGSNSSFNSARRIMLPPVDHYRLRYPTSVPMLTGTQTRARPHLIMQNERTVGTSCATSRIPELPAVDKSEATYPSETSESSAEKSMEGFHNEPTAEPLSPNDLLDERTSAAVIEEAIEQVLAEDGDDDEGAEDLTNVLDEQAFTDIIEEAIKQVLAEDAKDSGDDAEDSEADEDDDDAWMRQEQIRRRANRGRTPTPEHGSDPEVNDDAEPQLVRHRTSTDTNDEASDRLHEEAEDSEVEDDAGNAEDDEDAWMRAWMRKEQIRRWAEGDHQLHPEPQPQLPTPSPPPPPALQRTHMDIIRRASERFHEGAEDDEVASARDWIRKEHIRRRMGGARQLSLQPQLQPQHPRLA